MYNQLSKSISLLLSMIMNHLLAVLIRRVKIDNISIVTNVEKIACASIHKPISLELAIMGEERCKISIRGNMAFTKYEFSHVLLPTILKYKRIVYPITSMMDERIH